MNETNPYSSPAAQATDTPDLNNSSVASIIVTVLMWVTWIAFLFGNCVLLLYAYMPQPDGNKWILSFEWVVALLLLLTISLSFRFLLIRKTRKLWLLFIAYLLGIFFTNMITVTGMFAMFTGQQTSILIGIIAVLFYCPYWIKVPKNRSY